MVLPDFIKTEWKDKGSVEVHFVNSKVINTSPRLFSSQLHSITDGENEPSKSFCDNKFSCTNENYKLNDAVIPGTFSVQCGFSTFNIWEYEAKSSPHLANIDYRLHNEIPFEDTEGKLMKSDLSEDDCTFLNEKLSSSLMNSENIIINDVTQCLEPKDIKVSNNIALELEYEAKSIPHLTDIDLVLHNQVSIDDSEGKNSVELHFKKLKEKYLSDDENKCLNGNDCTSPLNSKNILINDVTQCVQSQDIKICKKSASKMKPKAKNTSCSNKDPTWQPGGVAWALQYCQNQVRDVNQIQNNTTNDNEKIYEDDEKKIDSSIVKNVLEFFKIAWLSVYQIMNIFNFGSIVNAFYTRIFKGSDSEKDEKISLQRDRMEVKALKNMRSCIGNLIKVYPKTPLLCENNGMIVQKVKLDSNFSYLNRGRLDELIRISSNNGQTDITLDKESNEASGVYVTYLSQQDVQYILDNKQVDVSVLHDEDILQPFQTEIKYDASETNNGNHVMQYHKMISKVVRDFKLMQFMEDPSFFADIPQEIPKSVENYWIQRHRLFIRYDEGICLDEESWYSVTPEIIAAHQAQRCACDTVVDAFCGAGGNAIQLAAFCNKVIAIDIDPKKIELAQNNARVYGVLDRIEFIVGDFLELAPNLKGDVVFLSPPWGGMSYNKKIAYDIFQLDGTLNGKKIYEAASAISSNIALFLPKSSNIFQAILLAGPDGRVDLEYAHISNKRKGLTAYYGNLVDFNYDSEEFE